MTSRVENKSFSSIPRTIPLASPHDVRTCIDKSPIHSVFPLSLPHESHLSRIYGGVYCYEIAIPSTLDTTMITPVRCSRSSGRLFWIVSHRESMKNPPRTRRRSNVHAFSCAPSMIHRTRWNETERLIIVERASRVNVTSRNNLGLERVNAKSGVQIVRRAKQRQPTRRDTMPFRCKIPTRSGRGITLIPEMLGRNVSSLHKT